MCQLLLVFFYFSKLAYLNLLVVFHLTLFPLSYWEGKAPSAQPRWIHYTQKVPFFLFSILLLFFFTPYSCFSLPQSLLHSPTLLNKFCTVPQSPLKIHTIHVPIISLSYLLHSWDCLSKLCLVFFNSLSISSCSVLVFIIFLFITYLSDLCVCVFYLHPCYFTL